MPRSSQGFLASLPKKVFQTTGIHLNTLLKFFAVLLVAAVGIGWTLLSTGVEQESELSKIDQVELERLSNEEKLRDVSSMPDDFHDSLPVTQISLLNSKIEAGEELINAGESYASKASELLVFLYGTRCTLEEFQGLDSEKSYRRLAELRREALEANNEKLVGSADFLRAVAATNRLKRRAEIADFRFASDAVVNLNSSKLTNLGEAKRLYLDAVNLHKTSSDQDSAAIFVSLIADKLIGSPEGLVSKLGRALKDYPQYVRFYEASEKLPQSSKVERAEFYDQLFAEVQNSPPQSAKTYQVIVKLLDRLVNKTDLKTASFLTNRLSQASATAAPETKIQIDESIENIKTRIASLNKTIDLSGTLFDGSTLDMPNGKQTTLLFWRNNDKGSLAHLDLLASSEWFDPWETNVLLACQSTLSEEELVAAGQKMSQFKVLDNATSRRLVTELGIDLVPYQVSLDKDGKVTRLGGSTN